MSFFFLSAGCLFLFSGVSYLAYLTNLPSMYTIGSLLILLTLAALTVIHTARRTRI